MNAYSLTWQMCEELSRLVKWKISEVKLKVIYPGQLQPHPQFFFKKVEIFISLEVYTYVVTAC